MPEQLDPGDRPPQKGTGGRPRREGKGVTLGRLKVHDPFALVRWPALSQPELPLEQLVEVAAYADRQLSRGGRRSKGKD